MQAQPMCDEDAGAVCEEDDDGGIDEPSEVTSDPDEDGGVVIPDDGGAQSDAGTVGEYDECSCEAFIASEQGTIHVCTESFDPDVCDDFGCNRGTVRRRPCDREGSELCCEMRVRGLKAHLYADCDHPNCEGGFRQQCRDFGGSVIEGACEAPDRPDRIVDEDEDEDDGGFCAVARPGGGGSRGAPWLGLLGLLGGVFRVRRRQRARTSSPS